MEEKQTKHANCSKLMKECLHVAQLDATTCSGPLEQNPCLAKRLYALDVLY